MDTDHNIQNKFFLSPVIHVGSQLSCYGEIQTVIQAFVFTYMYSILYGTELEFASIITIRNEIAKVMFLHVSVILFTGGGVLSQHALQVVSQHALEQGVPALGGLLLKGCLLRGCLLWGGLLPGGCLLWGGACSRGWGCLLEGGCLLWGCVETPPESRQLLLQTVCILLECILVGNITYWWKVTLNNLQHI